jgi:hypothetical protein
MATASLTVYPSASDNAVRHLVEQRIQDRRFVRMAAWVIFYRHGLRKHVSMVRDLNRSGIFFYSSFRPTEGTELEFVMKFPKWTNLGPVACKGRVLRVEQPVPRAAIGVAMKLTRFWVLGNDNLKSSPSPIPANRPRV